MTIYEVWITDGVDMWRRSVSDIIEVPNLESLIKFAKRKIYEAIEPKTVVHMRPFSVGLSVNEDGELNVHPWNPFQVKVYMGDFEILVEYLDTDDETWDP